MGGFHCIPKIMDKYENEWMDKLLEFMNTYKEDMPNYDSCRGEVKCWETLWKNFEGELPSTVDQTL